MLQSLSQIDSWSFESPSFHFASEDLTVFCHYAFGLHLLNLCLGPYWQTKSFADVSRLLAQVAVYLLQLSFVSSGLLSY